MELLAETSDAVQIATLITGCIATLISGMLTYLMARLNVKANIAAVATEKAAHAAAHVRDTLRTTNSIADDKLNSIADTSEKVLERVNGQTRAQLEQNARTARLLAVVTNEGEHKEAARAADEALAAHIRTDDQMRGEKYNPPQQQI